jgi:hypothetical protein
MTPPNPTRKSDRHRKDDEGVGLGVPRHPILPASSPLSLTSVESVRLCPIHREGVTIVTILGEELALIG